MYLLYLPGIDDSLLLPLCVALSLYVFLSLSRRSTLDGEIHPAQETAQVPSQGYTDRRRAWKCTHQASHIITVETHARTRCSNDALQLLSFKLEFPSE
jgi:hypothetical protein